MDVVHNRGVFNCSTCETRQCENENGEEWKSVVQAWELSPAAEWNARVCPKPSAIKDAVVSHWFKLYCASRDRGIYPDSGGYNDQSAKIMEAFAIMSVWQQEHERQQRNKQKAAARHNKALDFNQ